MAKENPRDRKYTPDHEWAWMKEEGRVVVGITDYAQEQLTDVVFVELPEIGTPVKRGGQLAVVESVKSVSNVYAPVSGEVVAVNEKLVGDPGLINRDAFGEGWMAMIEMTDPAEWDQLLDATAYERMISGEDS